MAIMVETIGDGCEVIPLLIGEEFGVIGEGEDV
jgi:hypothetical protein